MGEVAASNETRRAGARIVGLKVTESVCPYCAVGGGEVVYTRDGELVEIEGDLRSPVNRGTRCPKGSASRQFVQQPGRLTKVRYRRPGGTDWAELELCAAMDMIAERPITARERGSQDNDHAGRKVDRTLSFAHLGGATLDDEENFLIRLLLHELREGPARMLTFVKPAGANRPLPLDERGVALFTGSFGVPARPGTLEVSPGERLLSVDRIVTEPRRVGPRLRGIACGGDGFLPTDPHGRLPGRDACTPPVPRHPFRSSTAAWRPSKPTQSPRGSQPRSASTSIHSRSDPSCAAFCAPASRRAICAPTSAAAPATTPRSRGTRCGGRRTSSPVATSRALPQSPDRQGGRRDGPGGQGNASARKGVLHE